MKSILKLRLSSLSEVCGKEFKEAVFTIREWNLLQEMKDILAPFAEATEMTEGICCMISHKITCTGKCL